MSVNKRGLNFRFYLPWWTSGWCLMVEWFWWGKGIYIVYRIIGKAPCVRGDYKFSWKFK